MTILSHLTLITQITNNWLNKVTTTMCVCAGGQRSELWCHRGSQQYNGGRCLQCFQPGPPSTRPGKPHNHTLVFKIQAANTDPQLSLTPNCLQSSGQRSDPVCLYFLLSFCLVSRYLLYFLLFVSGVFQSKCCERKCWNIWVPLGKGQSRNFKATCKEL